LVHQADGQLAGPVQVLQQRSPPVGPEQGDARDRRATGRAHGSGGRTGLMGRMSRLGNELYNGRRSIDFVSKRGLWYVVSLVLVGIALGIVLVKGLAFGIEFTGGTQYRVPVAQGDATQENADALREA